MSVSLHAQITDELRIAVEESNLKAVSIILAKEQFSMNDKITLSNFAQNIILKRTSDFEKHIENWKLFWTVLIAANVALGGGIMIHESNIVRYFLSSGHSKNTLLAVGGVALILAAIPPIVLSALFRSKNINKLEKLYKDAIEIKFLIDRHV
jgi:hypothetical protein